MGDNRLTFIIPVYKPDLGLLRKVCKALKDQSFKAWGAVFVLDGLNASAKDVITQTIGRQVRIIEQPQAGVQRARNHGFEAADSEFVVWWDCDCLIEPDTAQTWINIFDKNPDIHFVYSGYKFLDEQGAIDSENFDPWMLKVRNYISTCSPIRREFAVKWNEDLKSLQDWDFWLSVVEKGGKGKYIQGHAFSTQFPDADSISGQGCTHATWLERVDAVKKLHNLPERGVCVSSLTKRHEGIWLAKLINADYQDMPADKPHKYHTIIQLGFSFLPGMAEAHCKNFSEKCVKKILFWTCDDIAEVWTRLNHEAIKKYRILLNGAVRQYVEDKASKDLLEDCGFKVDILPLPMEAGEVGPFPEKPRFAVDIAPAFGFLFNTLEKSLPDVELSMLTGNHRLEDFSGLCHFHPDRTTSIGLKRAVLAGKHIVSNVRAPFMGYIDDTQKNAFLVPEFVEKIRELVSTPQQLAGRDFYLKLVSPEKFNELIAA